VGVDETLRFLYAVTCCPFNVTDVTNRGAGIRTHNLSALPTSFDLTFDNFRTIRRCRLIWREGDFLGLALELAAQSIRSPLRHVEREFNSDRKDTIGENGSSSGTNDLPLVTGLDAVQHDEIRHHAAL